MPPGPSAAKPARLDNVQCLRGVACLLVVLYHLADAEAGFGLGQNPLKPLRYFGYAGVDLFFVISGFIIAATTRPNLGRAAAVPGYLFRRLWRVYPTYWAALPLALGVYAATTLDALPPAGWPGELIDTLLLVPQPPSPRVLPVAWTLSYEVMFYAAFAAVLASPRRLGWLWLAAWAGLVVWASAAGHAPTNRLAALATSPFVLEFLGGVAAASLCRPLGARAAAGATLVATGWLVAALAWFHRPDPAWLATHIPERVLAFGPPSALLVLAAAGRELGGGRLSWRRLTRLGDASYSVYLLHTPLIVAGVALTHALGWRQGKWSHLAWLAAMLPLAVLPGVLFHRRVERRLVRAGRRGG